MENLTYLTVGLPTRPGYATLIAKRLNDKHIAPSKGGIYTNHIVYNVVHGRQPDENVKLELIRYRSEQEENGQHREKIEQHINSALELLNA